MKSWPTFQNTIFKAAILNTNFFKPSSLFVPILFSECVSRSIESIWQAAVYTDGY